MTTTERSTAIGYANVKGPLTVCNAHSTLPEADAQTECRQSGGAYFGKAAGTAIDDAVNMGIEWRHTDLDSTGHSSR